MAGTLRSRQPGGSRRLASLLARYGEAIEADLAFRGIDLAQLWRGRRWRLLLNLIEHLPRGSAFAEAVAEDDDLADRNAVRPTRRRSPPVSEFTPDVELLAAVHDRIGNLITVVAATSGSKKPPKPKPWPRPVTAAERAERRRAKSDFNDIVAVFAPHEARRDT